MTKRTKVGITEKRRIAKEIGMLHADGHSVPEACAQFNIKPYTYYNWLKRIEQLDARKKVQVVPKSFKKFIIRKKPVEQTAKDLPEAQGAELAGKPRYVVITANNRDELREALSQIL